MTFASLARVWTPISMQLHAFAQDKFNEWMILDNKEMSTSDADWFIPSDTYVYEFLQILQWAGKGWPLQAIASPSGVIMNDHKW